MIKKLRVTVDGKSYDVTVELPDDGAAGAPLAAPAPAAVAAPPPPPPAVAPLAPPPAPAAPASAVPAAAGKAGGPGAVLSPLTGRVTAVVATVGQQVKENDHLLTLEAMKMNTFVFAHKAGKVAEISTAVGAAVEEGQVLARIE
jgi:biotin carboxyl carrier protein